MEVDRPPKKAICTAPSFGRLINNLPTNQFRNLNEQYYNSRLMQLPHATASLPELVRYASAALESKQMNALSSHGAAPQA